MASFDHFQGENIDGGSKKRHSLEKVSFRGSDNDGTGGLGGPLEGVRQPGIFICLFISWNIDSKQNQAHI